MQGFDIDKFPYPIAQSYRYIPKAEDDIRKNALRAIQKIVTCFETVCRFCVWEMTVEYSRIEERDEKLNGLLASSLFFKKGGKLTTGQWVDLLRELSRFLRTRKASLFMPEVPSLYFNAKGGASRVAKSAIDPFPNLRSESLGHTDPSFDEEASYAIKMLEKLDTILGALGFIENYCLISVTQVKDNIVREAYRLDGSEKKQMDVWKGRLRFTKEREIRRDMTLLIKRGAFDSKGEQPFLLYPIFLFAPYEGRDSKNLDDVPNEIYALKLILHQKDNIESMLFSGHRQGCKPKLYTYASENPGLRIVIDEFRSFVGKFGILCLKADENECKPVSVKPSPFDLTQEDKVRSLLKIYLERPEALGKVEGFLTGEGGCLVIQGEPGSGKSAFAAHLISGRKTSSRQVIYHLIGPTRRDWRKIIASLLWQLQEKYGKFLDHPIGMPPDGIEDESTIRFYQEGLSRVNSFLERTGQKLLIVIDALDELIPANEDPKLKNLFEFVPGELPWEHIHFVITTRPGYVLESFLDHMGGSFPDIFELARMERSEIEALAALYRVTLEKNEVETLFKITEGSPLYLSRILEKLKRDRDYNLSDLPQDDVMAFFRKDLIEKYGIRENELLRNILALLLVFKVQPSAWHFSEILGVGSEAEIDRLLLRISPYLITSAQKTYSFFHPKFVESLTYGRDPLLKEEDILNLHRKVINWCEPFENWDERDPKFQYGFDRLPYHYWILGEKHNKDAFDGFLSFLGRGNVNCELACRIFLREIITSKSEGELIKDDILARMLKNSFMRGNYFARHGLMRFSADLGGFGYDEFRRKLWDSIITEFNVGDYWHDEIFVKISHALSEKRERLNLALNRIGSYESISNMEHLRRFYNIAGIILCNVTTSGQDLDVDKGLLFFNKSIDILESLTPDDYLQFCLNSDFAAFTLWNTKGWFYNDYAISLRRSGKIDDAIIYYTRSLDILKYNHSQQKIDFVRRKVIYAISLVSHNLGYLLFLKGNFIDSMDLFNDAIYYRCYNRMIPAISASINLISNIFEDLYMLPMVIFLKRLICKISNDDVLDEKIKVNGWRLSYYICRSEVDKAWKCFTDLANARIKKRQDHSTEFKNLIDRLRILIEYNRLEDISYYLKESLSILDEYSESKTFDVVNRNFFTSWEPIFRAFLVTGKVNKAKEILYQKLNPWFERYQFNALLPRFYNLQAEYYDKTNQPEEAAKLRAQAAELIEAGRRSIADKHFPQEVIQYMDYLVESANDEKLTEMYGNVRERLATGFVPEYASE